MGLEWGTVSNMEGVTGSMFVNEKGLKEREDDEGGEDIISEAMY